MTRGGLVKKVEGGVMTREGLEKKNPSQFYTKLQLWKFDGDHQTNNLKGIKNYPYLNLDLSFQEEKKDLKLRYLVAKIFAK